MDNILINLDDGISLTPTSLPSVNEQPTILMPSEVNNIPGPAGPPGKDGKDGQAATITVGSTTTGNPGTNASVINSGTSSAAILDFTIPRGDTGANGEAATISVGTTTTGAPGSNASVINSGDEQDAVLEFTIPTGAAGPAATVTVGSVQTVAPEYPATVTNSGTTSAAVLDFEIPQGIAGTPGQDGAPGADGQAATVSVGTTTTGNPGTNASVTNSGTSSAAVLNFTIPRGATGDTGPAGADGIDGAPGQAATITVGSTTTGAAGTNASVTNSGTSSAAVLDFTIPRGATGSTGPAGADGQAATVTVGSTTTGSAGTNASVINSGTSSAAILDFVIPRGADGTSETPTFVDGTGDSLDCTAVKYPSGLMICYGAKGYSGLNVTSSYQGSYYGSLNMSNVYPVAFTSTPATTVTLYNSGKLITCNFSNRSTTGFNLYIWGQTSTSNMNLTVNYIAIGKWK